MKVSIIVPVYKTEKYLRKCLDSLVNQTLKEIEIIIINDGSNDNSLEIIKQYQNNYFNIVLIDKENEGIGITRNKGILKAKGKYICFVDSDDYVSYDYAKNMYEYASNNNLDLVITNYIEENEITDLKKEILLPSFDITNLKDNPSIINLINHSPWNKLYKKDIIDKYNISFIPKTKYEDMPFILEYLYYSNKIGKLEVSDYVYIIHSNSETTIRDKKMLDIIKIINIIYTFYKEKKDFNIYEQEVNNLVVSKLTNYNIQQRYQQSSKVGNKFIDETFKYLNTNISNWKECSYFKNRSFFKKIIESSKVLTKLYCYVYRLME